MRAWLMQVAVGSARELALLLRMSVRCIPVTPWMSIMSSVRPRVERRASPIGLHLVFLQTIVLEKADHRGAEDHVPPLALFTTAVAIGRPGRSGGLNRSSAVVFVFVFDEHVVGHDGTPRTVRMRGFGCGNGSLAQRDHLIVHPDRVSAAPRAK